MDASLVSYCLPSLIIATFLYLRRRSYRLSYPPGPKGVPLLGVALEHPKTEYWKTYAEWERQCGRKISPGEKEGERGQNEGIISFHVLGRRIIVLNNARVAEEMLDQLSAIYSDRPFPTMAGLLMRREKSIFMMKYGERLRTYRKLMHQDFGPTGSKKYWSVQEDEARLLILNLINDQIEQEKTENKDYSQLERLLRKNSAAVILRIGYGINIKISDDYFVAMAEESMRVGSLAAAPGKWLVDSLPILRFLPRWFPGAGFHHQAEAWGKQLYEQSLIPHNHVKSQMEAGTAAPSFTSHHLQLPLSDEDEDVVFWTAGALYAGAADTTTSAVKSFFVFMLLNPSVQFRAYTEITRVIGSDRLPTLADRSELPYVNALMLEVLRCAPPTPLGLPHAPAEDNVFHGYAVHKGDLVLANIWAILHDESLYPDPDVFNPDRFFPLFTRTSEPATGVQEQLQPDPRRWVFGFGRRVCPGSHIAEASLFIQIASVLASLEICPAIDRETGKEIVPKVEYSTAIVSYVKNFPYRLKTRSDAAAALVHDSVASLE
ncbi:hypothetical protein M0805_009574 [Coniferiporia weirii]|nr:hypothetical protein M0805_009574 [Coniferiporia weirii]